MRAIKHRIHVKSAITDKVRLYALGDIHWGAPGCAEDTLRATVAEIANNEHAYWLGMGDYIDAVTHNDRRRFNPAHYVGTRYKISDLADLAQIQADEFVEVVEPIKDKCIGLIEGNHEWVNPKHNAADIMARIVAGIEAPYLGPSAFVHLYVMDAVDKTRYKLTVWAHHGFGGGRLAGGDALTLQRLIMQAEADIYLMGHRHKSIILPEVSLYANEAEPPDIVHRPRVGGMTGTFLKSSAQNTSDYAEQLGLPPVVLGAPYVEMWCQSDQSNGKRIQYVPVFQMMHPPLSRRAA